MTPTATADRLAAVALELSYRVREEDPESNARWLTKSLPTADDRFNLLFVLAAAIPQDRTWRELIAWASEPAVAARERRGERSRLQPCGTRAAYRRHLIRGETPDQPCRDAAAAYKRKYSTRRTA